MFHMQRQRRLPEEHARFYAAEISLALNFLHTKGILNFILIINKIIFILILIFDTVIWLIFYDQVTFFNKSIYMIICGMTTPIDIIKKQEPQESSNTLFYEHSVLLWIIKYINNNKNI